jgi:uncharacterized protein YbjT (DUF2867 family)
MTDATNPTNQQETEKDTRQDTRRVTIFGGSGFIGRSIVQRLVENGTSVRVAARRPETVKDHLPREIGDKVEAVRADIHDDAAVTAAVRDSEAVINLVAILYEKGRQTFRSIHVEGARRVAAAAKQAGARRMIQMSALGASPVSEAAYARTKAAGEQAVREVFADATVVRPSIVFGRDDDFFNRFAGMASMSPRPSLRSSAILRQPGKHMNSAGLRSTRSAN